MHDHMPPNAESKVDLSRRGLTPGGVNVGSAAKWVKGLGKVHDAEALRLFCFPFAGGGASAFAGWLNSFPPHVAACAIQYTGREDRWGEPGFPSLSSLVETLADVLAPHLGARFAFFGHSFGGLVAFELTRALQRRGGPAPVRLFISGARAPQLPPRETIHGLAEQDFLKKLCEFGGMPAEVLGDADLLPLILPIIREDFRLLEEYRFEEAAPLPVPISAFGRLKDKAVPVADLLAWSAQTCKAFRSRFLEGHHFFLFDAKPKIVSHIVEDLEAAAGDSQPAGRADGGLS